MRTETVGLFLAGMLALGARAVAGASAETQPPAAAVTEQLGETAVPEPGNQSEYAVPFELIQKAALNRAQAVWTRLSPGPVIPYQDPDGNTVAYVFHYRVDGQPFPADYARAAREAQEDIARFHDEGRAPPTGKFRYANVLVSARSDRAPVLAWGEGLSEFFATAGKARQAAAQALAAAAPELKRIYFIWPSTWYDFQAAGRSVVIHTRLLSRQFSEGVFQSLVRDDREKTRQEIEAGLAKRGLTWDKYTADLSRKSETEWTAAQQPIAPHDGTVFVQDYAKAPFYDWSFGCAPTSAAMIFGWLDQVRNYGRLVNYFYQRYDLVENDTDFNVPDAQLDLAIAMGTDSMNGSTLLDNFAPGVVEVAYRLRNYPFTVPVYKCPDTPNWCWDEAIAALNVGQAIGWSAHNDNINFHHAISLFGADGDAAAFWCHNTWDPPGLWMHYTDNGNYTYTAIRVFAPMSYPPDANITLQWPDGDERYNRNGQGDVWHAWETTTIGWNPRWFEQDSVRVFFSNQGGRPGTWAYWGKTTNYGMVVDVDPALASDSCRIMVVLFYHSADQPYAAADGNYGNFRIVNVAPCKPEIIWPGPNWVLNTGDTLGWRRSLRVHRISYARQYEFMVHNSVVGDQSSGWLDAETTWAPTSKLPVGSSGYWRCRAQNPTGIGNWTANTAYTVALDTGPRKVVHRNYPPRKKKAVKKGHITHSKPKKKKAGMLDDEPEDQYVYLLRGDGTRDFQRYSVWADTWCSLCSLPPGPRGKTVKTGGYLVTDTDYVYAFKGGGTSEFYRYDPDLNIWDSLASPHFLKGMKGGYAAMVDIDGQGFIYAGNGAATNEWQRFRTATGTWEPAVPAGLPVEKARLGSSLVWDGDSILYFLHAGGKENDFYALNLRSSAPVWVPKQSLPLVAVSRKKKVREGGCIEWFQGKVYAVKGGGTREFWSFDPAQNSWTYLCEAAEGPTVQGMKGIKCGRSLTAGEYGIYVLIGNNTDEFYFYPGDEPGPGSGMPAAAIAAPTGVAAALTLTVGPNPFTRLSHISYSLPKAGYASLKLYDVTGALRAVLVSGYHKAGVSDFELRASDLPRGIYLVRLETDVGRRIQKLILE